MITMTEIGKWHDMEIKNGRLKILITELADALEEQLVKQNNKELFPWSIIHRARESVKE